MTPTTPPRPFDVAALFPGIEEHATTATRLHPRPGTPTAADSSIGGPLRWPADEPWPVCEDGDAHHVHRLSTPAAVHRSREIIAEAERRAASTGTRYTVTDQERAELSAAHGADLGGKPAGQPIPLIPVAQLYRRDVPDFAGPGDSDLLQVLWCPLDHSEERYHPRVRCYWRRSADIVTPFGTAPEPPVVVDRYLPVPCIVQPEQIVEYQYADLLPDELTARIDAWEDEDRDSGEIVDYQFDLSLAPGWKVGGYANWSLTDPHPVDCAACGTPMTLLFTAASSEGNGPSCSWTPDGEPAHTPTKVTIGRGYDLYVFRCPVSFDHPTATAMQ
jgi:hypothetical protein